MSTRTTLALSGLGALVVCLAVGYAWGASGRRAAEIALDDARQQMDLAEARGAILEGRVNLYNMNFGDASARLEDAKVPLRRVRQRYLDAGHDPAAADIDAALGDIDEAQRLAGKLDQSANTKAGEALRAVAAATSKSLP